MDITSSTAALRAYATARHATQPSATDPAEKSGFAQLAQSFNETLINAEETAKAAMVGKADPHALVEALAQTELAIETAVTVRDKVVEAYQEILRMPV
ncbi:flagellar hook-basal body complex protein FliE [Actibacterium lipolyticum]|uniref:Flagellar hook-basal body complex protein FliE n=1 Tax=Actibacterium lipolyticum TaxID=1524263 RepID=A0A238KZC4_9RHOB|nr:flagellar hook-basal body complex protein FliE [Actibacterium lipolyticum]SMX47436.1 flagellar hook-basal body protein FliE [Actibacterium lipolyticum]